MSDRRGISRRTLIRGLAGTAAKAHDPDDNTELIAADARKSVAALDRERHPTA